MYQRQGDNIITWCEAPPLIGAANGAGAGGGGVDLALSFQVGFQRRYKVWRREGWGMDGWMDGWIDGVRCAIMKIQYQTLLRIVDPDTDTALGVCSRLVPKRVCIQT